MPQTKDTNDTEPTADHFTSGDWAYIYDLEAEVDAYIRVEQSILTEVKP